MNRNFIFNTMNCPCCNMRLQKQIIIVPFLIKEKCRYCRYFIPNLGMSWRQYYPEGCSCDYGEEESVYIVCNNCIAPKCIKCIKSLKKNQ